MLLKKIFLGSAFLITSLCGAFPSAFAIGTLQISRLEGERPTTLISQKVLTIAYAQLGIKLNFVATPALRTQLLWDNDQLDGIAVRVFDPGFASAHKFSTPVAFGDVVVFAKNKNLNIHGFDSLKPYTVGYIAGFPYMEEKLKDVKKEPAPSLESMFRKLDAGRSDIAVDARYSLCVAKKLGFEDIIVVEPSLETQAGYHYLHKRHQNLIPALEKILVSMEKDGTIRKIQNEVLQNFKLLCP